MIYIGIDGGIAGALAMYNSETNDLETIPMPVVKVASAKGNKNQYDIPRIIEWLKQFQSTAKMIVLEKAQAFPGQGAVSMFSVGRAFGIIEGILATLGTPHAIVHPKTWQKKMYDGISHKGRDQSKQAGILVAQRLFPNHKFIVSDKATKIHDGMTDATMLAVYASKL